MNKFLVVVLILGSFTTAQAKPGPAWVDLDKLAQAKAGVDVDVRVPGVDVDVNTGGRPDRDGRSDRDRDGDRDRSRDNDWRNRRRQPVVVDVNVSRYRDSTTVVLPERISWRSRVEFYTDPGLNRRAFVPRLHIVGYRRGATVLRFVTPRRVGRLYIRVSSRNENSQQVPRVYAVRVRG